MPGGLEGVGHAVVLAGLPDDRVAVVLAAVVHGHPHPQGDGGLPVADGRLVAAVALTWVLRFRVSPETSAWRRGAVGERRTARLLSHLEDRGWVVLHDLAVPGSQAHIDCDDARRGGRGAV